MDFINPKPLHIGPPPAPPAGVPFRGKYNTRSSGDLGQVGLFMIGRWGNSPTVDYVMNLGTGTIHHRSGVDVLEVCPNAVIDLKGE